MAYVDTYKALLARKGVTRRDRNVNIVKRDILLSAPDNPACKEIFIDGEPRYVVVNSQNDYTLKEIVTLPGDERIPFGCIVEFNNKPWIVTSSDIDEEIYSKAKMQLCACVLRWEHDGVIYDYPAYVEDATKYSEGVDATRYLGIGEFQIKAKVHMDEISTTIHRDMRFIIDADHLVSYVVDSGERPYVFRVTRRNIVTGSYGEEGYIEITMVQDQWIEGKDDYETMVAAQPEQIKEPYPAGSPTGSGWL